jgi:hypothetical protein
MGIPVALVYLGFVEDSEIAVPGDYFANVDEWNAVIRKYIEPHFPLAQLEQEIGCNMASFWLLSRSLPCIQLSPPLALRKKKKPSSKILLEAMDKVELLQTENSVSGEIGACASSPNAEEFAV